MHLALVLATLFAAGPAPAETELLVRFGSGRARGFDSQVRLARGEEYYGTVAAIGDTVTLGAGDYTAYLEYGRHSLQLPFTVTESEVRLGTWRAGAAACGPGAPHRVSDWKVAVTKRGNVFFIALPPPTLVYIGMYSESNCSLGNWMSVGTMRVKVESNPPGAAIFRDENRLAATPATVSLALTERDKDVYLAIKKRGFGACIRKVPAAVDAEVSVACTLRPIIAP